MPLLLLEALFQSVFVEAGKGCGGGLVYVCPADLAVTRCLGWSGVTLPAPDSPTSALGFALVRGADL